MTKKSATGSIVTTIIGLLIASILLFVGIYGFCVHRVKPANAKLPYYYLIAASIGGIMFLGHFISFLVWCMGGTTVSEKNLKLAMVNGCNRLGFF